MPTPDPTYDDGLVLVDQPLLLDSMSRTAHLTFACTDDGAQTAQQIADAWHTNFTTVMSDALSDQVTIGKATVKRGDGTTTPSVAVAAGATVAGTADVGTLPSPNIACLLKKITSLAGRENRGRTYLPWAFGEAGISDTGLLTGDQIAVVQTQASLLLTELASDDIPMVICNRIISANPTPPPATYISRYATGATVVQFTLEAYAATQRRRMPRS